MFRYFLTLFLLIFSFQAQAENLSKSKKWEGCFNYLKGDLNPGEHIREKHIQEILDHSMLAKGIIEPNKKRKDLNIEVFERIDVPGKDAHSLVLRVLDPSGIQHLVTAMVSGPAERKDGEIQFVEYGFVDKGKLRKKWLLDLEYSPSGICYIKSIDQNSDSYFGKLWPKSSRTYSLQTCEKFSKMLYKGHSDDVLFSNYTEQERIAIMRYIKGRLKYKGKAMYGEQDFKDFANNKNNYTTSAKVEYLESCPRYPHSNNLKALEDIQLHQSTGAEESTLKSDSSGQTR